MPFASALSTEANTLRSVEEACSQAGAQLQGAPDLALVFYSQHHAAAADKLAGTLAEKLQPRCLLGCPGEAIVGNEREIEGGPALSLWLARWSRRVDLVPFHLAVEETADGYSLLGWPDDLASADPEQAVIVLLADPFSFPVDAFLNQINQEYPGLRVVGGMASGARQPGQITMLQGQESVHEGAVAVLLQGPMRVRSVVSQGCRPIGQHMVVTRAQENIIVELGGQPPLARLQQVWQELPTRDRELVQRGGLHIGRVINEYQGEFQRGDFLVRNVMEVDRQTGAMAVTDRVRVGQTVQFHVRDAATADEDLHELLQIDLSAHAQRPAAALLFSCNGRGTRLFDEPHHDAGVVRAEAGPIPVAGFFAQGELGPVGGQNFIHGFTASVVLFEDL
jgi:small ligand-binding sensory domain FIST